MNVATGSNNRNKVTISTTVPVTTSRTACKVNAETFANPGMIHTTKYDATENHITEK